MLNKIEILTKLKKLNFPINQYCVMTGAALVLHGIKETTADIDIGCSEELLQWLQQQGYKLQRRKKYEGIVIDDCIEVFGNWKAEKVVYKDGIPIADIQCIRKYKEDLSREKDLADIKLIDEYIAAKAKNELES
ncbi:MAG: hypothetical protein K0Q99_1940 [Clostridia bacterium]|nr:hypothetical protein [Clostridia bacterium]